VTIGHKWFGGQERRKTFPCPPTSRCAYALRSLPLLRHWFELPVAEQSRNDAISSLIAWSL